MINYHSELVTALDTILPTYYEMTLKSGIATPCISYMETNNYMVTDAHGASLGYSRVTFTVKVWAQEIGVANSYAAQIDEVLRPLGFKRISAGELYDNKSSMLQKIMSYEALIKEDY